MTRPKIKLFIAIFAYGGNGGIASTSPQLAVWLAQLNAQLAKDDRVEGVGIKIISDTPITMTRNQAVGIAQQGGFDMVLMLDSDNQPDGYLGADPDSKPFWDVAFEFAYERLTKGVPTVIAAPYCGPPQHPVHRTEGEVPYLFEWLNDSSEEGRPGYQLHRMNRNEAAKIRGIYPVAALPTGVCLFTTNAFEPLKKPYFYYEFNDDHTEKASTEDVVATRNISLAWMEKLGEPVIFAACDSWALHYKTKAVGRPVLMPVSAVSEDLRRIVTDNHKPDEPVRFVNFAKHVPERVVQEAASQAQAMPEPQHPDNEPFIMQRLINGRKVTSVGHMTFDGDLDALRNLVSWLAQMKPGKSLRIIEVGSWVCESAIAMTQGFGPAGGVVFCIDDWKGGVNDPLNAVIKHFGSDKIYEYFLKNAGDDIDERIRVLRGRSQDVLKGLSKPQEADMGFVDAGHTEQEAEDDIREIMRHIADDGIVAGHDYSTPWPGVVRAVQRICEEGGIQPNVIEDTAVWWFSKQDWLNGRKKKELAHAAA